MNKPILLDGASGTSLWAKAEARGIKKVPVWIYNIEHPEMVSELHHEYIAAGSDVILANVFGANGPSVKRSSKYSVSEVVTAGVRLAKEAVAGTNVRVALSFGPLSALMEPYGDLEEDEVDEIYTEMVTAGANAGADLIVLETFIDLGMMVVAAKAAKRTGLPVICMMSFEKAGKTIMGNSVEQICQELEEVGMDAVGMNCSIGPKQAFDIIKKFSETTKLPLSFKPNSGLPVTNADGTTSAAYTAADFVSEVAPALEFVSYVGGCCGTDPTYIRALAEKIGE